MLNKQLDGKLVRRPQIGLVLSGGGARGLAHIGVLKVLARQGIPVDYLAGASMGGVIAAGYAAGMTPDAIEQEALAVTHTRRLLRLIDPTLPNGGLMRGQRLMAYFEQLFSQQKFADLHLPLTLVAVDLNTQKEIRLGDGPVALALRATTAIPGVFMPVETNGWRLVDGGLLNNLPVDVIREMGAEAVIAVDIGPTREAGFGLWIGNRRWVPEGLSATLRVLDDTLGTLMTAAQEHKLRQFPPDVLIQPNIPTGVNVLAGYDRAAELIAIGERAAEANLSDIKLLLRPRWRWPSGRKIKPSDKNLVQSSHSAKSTGKVRTGKNL
jgi:NTE family protein